MLYVPLGVLAATVTMPLASMLNGPVVNGVTLVLVVVAAMLLNVSFVNAFNAVTTVLFDNSYRWIVHCIDWIVYYNCGVASQFAGLAPTSHSS
jgi:hypothetical protein